MEPSERSPQPPDDRDDRRAGGAPASTPSASDARHRAELQGAIEAEDDLREEVVEGSRAGARIGSFLGPILAVAAVACTHPALGGLGGLKPDASWVLGLLALMAVWWVTLAVEPAITALVPAVALTLLGIGSTKEILGPYANEVIFLFGGGALLGHALDRTGISGRFASATIGLAGGSPMGVLAALMVVTALISAFVSNLATTATMLPLAVAIGARTRASVQGASEREAADRFSTSLLLGIAFASSIGGALTVIGSPPNPIAVKGLEQAGVPMDFVRWLWFSVPTTAVFLPIAIALIGLWLFPARGIRVPHDSQARGVFGRDGVVVLAVFFAAVGGWVLMPAYRQWTPSINDGIVAVAAITVLFLFPSTRRGGRAILEPSDFARIPWHVLVLFGGGLSLADAMTRSGLSEQLGALISAAGTLPSLALLAVLVTALVFASEVASNTTLAAMTVPIVIAIAPGLGIPPQKLAIPAVFAASWAFAMPVGTPPNALVYASGRVRAQDMMRAGLVLDVVAIFVIVVMAAILL